MLLIFNLNFFIQMKKQTILTGAILALALSANANKFSSIGVSENTLEQTDHKCGEGKCGNKKGKDHKCGSKKDTTKMKDHKCGEGKCGSKKKKKKK